MFLSIRNNWSKMAKGGARVASAKKAVAKGMGIPTFFKVLEEINNINTWTDVNGVMSNLPQYFGGSRNETCRSYFKELWRHDLIERKDGDNLTPCNNENWTKGGKPKYRISNKGKELLKIPDKHRVFALAWLIVRLSNKNDFEQLYKTFNTFMEKEVPLSMFKASKIVGVVRDSIKAIMYGWLEPLGFLDRTNNGTFKLDKEYYELVKSFKTMDESIPLYLKNSIETQGILIKTIKSLTPYAPEEDTKVEIPFIIRSSEKAKISIKCKVHPLFFNRFKIIEQSKSLNLETNKTSNIIITLELEKKKISESFKETELGKFEALVNNKRYEGALPTIFLTTKAHLHEINLSNLLFELGYEPIIFTKSDRPDMVIAHSRKEREITKFLHNDEFKILVETTSVQVLSLQKVKDDLENFQEHTKKVLKINAKRTLIVGKSISKTVLDNIEELKKTYHPFTIISMDNLAYLKQKTVGTNGGVWEKIKKILTFDGLVDKDYIDSTFK